MVTESYDTECHLIVARPNRSASWAQNKLCIALLCAWLFPLNVFFLVLGAWPVLPFAGAEVVALACVLYVVSRRQCRRQVLSIRADELVLEKGIDRPEERWQFPLPGLCVQVCPGRHHWDADQLALCDRTDRVPVGEFLNRDDSSALLACLRREGLPVVQIRAGAGRSILRS